MSITSDIEEKMGVNIEKLTLKEKEWYFNMLSNVQKSQLTPESMRTYIESMRDAVEEELVNEPEFNYIWIFKVPNRKCLLLKARLQNYRLLLGFLTSPEVAKQRLEQMVSSVIERLT